MLLPVAMAAGQTTEERLVRELAEVAAESDRRAAAFMRGILPRQAALKLNELTTPENLASRNGRDAIRSAYRSFGAIIDDIESFSRGEERWVEKALVAATLGVSPDMAAEAQRGFARGYARTSARHATLRAAQRESIKKTFELLDVIDRAPGGLHISNGRLSFADMETGMRVSHLIAELGRLELEEQKAEQEIESRRAPVQLAPLR